LIDQPSIQLDRDAEILLTAATFCKELEFDESRTQIAPLSMSWAINDDLQVV
jgi:hypothetical protein